MSGIQPIAEREREREGKVVGERRKWSVRERESKRKADWEKERLGTSIRRQNKPS